MSAVKYAVLLLLLGLVAGGVSAQTATPTPFGSIPESEIHDVIATSAANTNRLPDDISRPINNQSVVQTVDLVPLFSYIKWLFSRSTANELLGQSLAPIGLQLFVLFLITVVMVGIYLLVFTISISIKFAWWMINNILRLIEAIPVLE